MLEAAVLPDGSVGQVKVLDCSRPKVGFEDAAVAAVKQWRFEPGTRDGQPVEFSLKFRLNFAAGEVGADPRVSAGSFTADAKPGGAPLESTRTRPN
jgi:TonB family protein